MTDPRSVEARRADPLGAMAAREHVAFVPQAATAEDIEAAKAYRDAKARGDVFGAARAMVENAGSITRGLDALRLVEAEPEPPKAA